MSQAIIISHSRKLICKQFWRSSSSATASRSEKDSNLLTTKDLLLDMDSSSKANHRRKSVVILENKLDAGINSEEVNDATDNEEKDLMHTIRGESVLERSKDTSPVKKGAIGSDTISPRRRKAVRRPVKPLWLTILSILTKNCLLLAALLWLGQMIWKWTDKIQDHPNSAFVALEYDGRVSEIETSMKNVAKMFQVQLEVLDKKIVSEAGILKREIMKAFDENKASLQKELKSLEVKADSLGRSLDELKELGFVSKEELENVWNELKNMKDKDGSDVNLDTIRAFARNIIEKEIDKHAADGLGRVDYALASGGARVVEHSQPYTFGKLDSWSSALKRRHGVHVNAHKMLEPSFGEPGQCFALEGSSGYIQIRLRTAIIPEAVTVEHVSKSVAYDRSSAPKEGMVLGWFGEPIIDSLNPPTLHLIANFSYDLEKSNIQTFNAEPGIVAPINNVRLEIESNHGSSALTCIYRFRVHGYEPSSPAAIGGEQA